MWGAASKSNSNMLLGPGGTTFVSSGKVYMDTPKAMALLGFSSSKTFEQTNMAEIQSAFSFRIHKLEMEVHANPNAEPKVKAGKRDELRR